MTLRHLSFGDRRSDLLRAEMARVRRTDAAAPKLACFLRRLSLDLVGIARRDEGRGDTLPEKILRKREANIAAAFEKFGKHATETCK